MPYSVTKPFAALCGLVLADRGLVDLDAPLSSYWPELLAPTTLRQVLSHQSGLALLERPAPEEAFYDWDLMCRLVAEQPPLWEPGTACGESALLYGHQIGEVVRRVDGRTLGTFLRDEICAPHGLDFHVGVPTSDLARVADLTGFDDEFLRRGDEASGDAAGAGQPARRPRSGRRELRLAGGGPRSPAVNGHGTARSVAGLYVALREGRLLSAGLTEEMTSVAASGVDRVLGEPAEWGLGVALDVDGFGMGGVGGSFGWWSTEGDYAIGFLTGVIADHDRATRVDNAVRACLGSPSPCRPSHRTMASRSGERDR